MIFVQTEETPPITKQKGNIFLRKWQIILNQNLKGKWLNYSNLDLDDLSPIPAKYDLEITDQNQVNIDLNLKLVKKETFI